MAAHVLAFPWPLTGHINPMLHLASALLDAGLHVTFLHTDHNLRRLSAAGAGAGAGAPPSQSGHHPRLRLVSIPDGLPDDHPRSAATIMDLFDSMRTAGCAAFRALLRKELHESPPVTCVVADGVMPFAVAAAEDAGVPALAYRTESACGFLCFLSVPRLLDLGELAVPSDSDEPVRGVPGMDTFLRRRDLPRVVPESDGAAADDPVPVLLAAADTAARCCADARALILDSPAAMLGPTIERIAERTRGDVFAVGPLHAMPAYLERATAQWAAASGEGGSTAAAAWLDGHGERSVVYMNLGSLTMVTREQLAELLHGLVDAGHPFLCVLRPDMVPGMPGNEVLRWAAEAVAGAAGQGKALVVEWAAHRDLHYVLRHRAVGCFFTHAGWMSLMEAAVEGVPAVCWPYFADQYTLSRFVESVWKTGLDMKDVVCERGVVVKMVKEVMESPEIRAATEDMASKLRRDVAPGGSSAQSWSASLATSLSSGKLDDHPKTTMSATHHRMLLLFDGDWANQKKTLVHALSACCTTYCVALCWFCSFCNNNQLDRANESIYGGPPAIAMSG